VLDDAVLAFAFAGVVLAFTVLAFAGVDSAAAVAIRLFATKAVAAASPTIRNAARRLDS
jgi:hypothetical protein